MPRKPIGETAMTATERSRRRREKAKAMQGAATPPTDQPNDDIAVLASASEPEAIVAPPATPAAVDYPKMLYFADGKTAIVDNLEHEKQLMTDGWSTVPFETHRQRPVTSYGVLTSDPMVAMIREVIQEVIDAYDVSAWVEPD